MKRKITLLVLATICVSGLNAQLILSQDFNSASSVTATWSRANNSSPLGSTGWFMGNAAVFPAYNGADSTYFAANYNNTQGSTGTISNWLISPTVTLNNGGVFQFATRTNTAAPQNIAPDRLQLYTSAGTGSNTGGTSTSLGTFTNLIVSVNPSLTTTGYPTAWTVYTATLSGLAGPVTGRFGFRYFVTSAGPTGTNSSYIGIDDVKYTLPCPNPTLSIASSSNNICSGSLITLTVTGATTNTWSTGQTTSTINITPAASTVYTVTGSSTPNCNSTETIAITVTVTPNLSVADVTTCPGTAATLVASGATSYSWNTGATTATVIETPTITTTYSVTGYNGVCEDSQPVTVTLGASLSINATVNQGTLCSGNSATLTANGASTYTWLPNNSQSQNVTVTPGSTTVYTLTGSSGSCYGEDYITVTVLPSPTITLAGTPTLSANSVTTCINSSVTISASGASTYSWIGTANTTSVRTIVTPSTTGTYTYAVVGTGTNACSRSAVISVVANTCTYTAIESIRGNAASTAVFPNPFSNELTISGVNGRVEVYNALGQLVLKQAVAESETLRTESFAKGIYILKAYSADNKLMSTIKAVKN